MKKKLKIIIPIIIIFIVIIAIVIYIMVQNNKIEENTNYIDTEKSNNDTEKEATYYYNAGDRFTYYKEVKDDYSGEYDIQYLTLDATEDISSFEVCEYMNYSDYVSYCEKWNLKQAYNYENYHYIMFSYYATSESEYKKGTDSIESRLVGLKYSSEETLLYIWDGNISTTEEDTYAAYVIIIPTREQANTVNYASCITSIEYEVLSQSTDKPIIYLYPTKDTEVSVKLGYPNRLLTSYPQYINEWKVIAKENGDLTDLETGRNLYSLYYESRNIEHYQVEKEGFVIKGEDSAEFLEEKLAILGLTEREAEEFIIYWLPKLEENEYNYIRFASEEEIEENMSLEINPNPDTIIRVVMTFKGLKNPIEVKEQKLETPERTGFVAVEWGGTEIQ